MIKTDENKIYMTFGEGCYVLARDGDKVKSVCFGARVEPEDDMSALFRALSNDSDAIGSAELCVVDGADFKLTDVTVLDGKPDCVMPVLDGEKTVALTFTDDEIGVEQKLYYTTYSRGAVARRVEIKNNGAKPIELSRIGMQFALPAGEEILTECESGAVLGDGYGAAYGFVAMFGGACTFEVTPSNGDTHLFVGIVFDEPVTLESGKTLCSPEIVAAYSDNGTDGVSRIFHDLLRERALGEKRKVISVECDCGDKAKAIADRVATVAELGADILLTELKSAKKLEALSAECKSAGIGLGIRLNPESTEWQKADGFTAEFIAKDRRGAAYFDFADDKALEFFVGAATDFSVGHSNDCLAMPKALPDLAPEKLYAYLSGQYEFMRRLTAALPQLILEGSCGDVGALRFATAVYCSPTAALKYSVYIPPRAISCRIGESTAMKTAFDGASLYCLGYELDPLSLTDGLRRAVRAQVLCCRDDARLVTDGDFYRGTDYAMCVSKDKSEAYAVYRRGTTNGFKLRGLDVHNLYFVREIGKTFSGAALALHGIAACTVPEGETVTFHLRQVADYDN